MKRSLFVKLSLPKVQNFTLYISFGYLVIWMVFKKDYWIGNVVDLKLQKQDIWTGWLKVWCVWALREMESCSKFKINNKYV